MIHTLNNLIKTGDKKPFKKLIKQLEPFPAFIDVNIGVNMEFEYNKLHSVNYALKDKLEVENGRRVKRLSTHFFNYDPGHIPQGKTVIMTPIPSHNFEYWQNLYLNQPHEYKKEKKRIADDVIEIINKTFSTPKKSIKNHIEVINTCSPYTYYRWTYNYRGSYEGWIPGPWSTGRNIQKTIKGLERFYFTGHWVQPGGGIPAAALTGKNVAHIICHRDHKKFQTRPVANA